MKLYSYTIPYDDGAAPNPYWGILTLAICKPVIRRTAEIGDWIVATGSKHSPLGDIQNSIVYVMKVTDKLTMEDYDKHCKKNLESKIPEINDEDLRRHVGDCIYDFNSTPEGKLRPSVHGLGNVASDLGGKYVLLSDHFYYFGNKPIDFPKQFHKIIKSNQGHKSTSNNDIAQDFVNWIEGLNLERNKLYGKPQIHIDLSKDKAKVKPIADAKCKFDLEDELEFKKGIC